MTIFLDIAALPQPADPAMAQRNLEDWRTVAPDRDIPPALLDAVFGNSPHLSHCLLLEPAVLSGLLADGPDVTLDGIVATLRQQTAGQNDTAAVMRALRHAKRRVALLTGLADIAGLWPLESITGALSGLAETALSLSAAHLLRRAHEAGDIVLPHPDDPERDSGLVVLGMGKLGAYELNYSSDIDIIVFYDEDKIDYRGRRSIPEWMVRLTRELVRMMDERTADGYVFRTDLRLRPDPGSTPPAISLVAAEIYYEGFGQNWERAAMIKARQLAGDRVAGAAFLRFLRPFIWRKHLDFAAIQDIHAIKRQINAHRGGGRIAMAGHNVKLGRGGIREVEFFAQTQQLIWGGREPSLRVAGTCQSLEALAAAGRVEPEAAAEMIEAYRFLRGLEHRLQMTGDQQTQTLPDQPDKLRALAVFMGFAGLEDFELALSRRLRTVEGHYARLFEDAPPLAAAGNLVFTGAIDDPATLTTLEQMGFKTPAAVCARIRGWHHGRVRATRSTRARELLTELTPSLLAALARTGDPDGAFHRFDAFLSALPAGVPLFSLFTANLSLLDLVAELMGDAPRLAERLSHSPNLLDSVLSQDFYDPPAPAAELAEDLSRALALAGDYQEELDVARRWAHEQQFRVGVQVLQGLLEPRQAQIHLTDLADATLLAVQPRVEAEFARAHGRIPGGGAAIIAMGKMGGREMAATSDLDLILVYHAPEGVEASDGPKPLAPSVYFSRLTQRIINAITAKTGEGALYEVDMRLRPSGRSGPIATSLTAFRHYQRDMAWTWEHMALTRARVVTGPPELRRAIQDTIEATLRRPRAPATLLTDVADMRARMAREHKGDNPWEVKHRRGGLVDIEFIAQYLQLRWADRHGDLPATGTAQALDNARRLGLLTEADAEVLLDALRLWSAIQQVLRLTLDDGFTAEAAPGRLKQVLVAATAATHFDGLLLSMAERASAVQAVFARLIDDPARLLAAQRETEA